MVDDHTKAGNELATIASRYNVPVPTELDDKHRDLRDKLAKLQGADFDREYIDAMVDDHNEDLDKLGSRVDKKTLEDYKAQVADRASGKTVKADVKAVAILPERSDNAATMSLNEWASTAYPVVQAHLDTAKTLQKTIKKRMTD
jgi:putative membrane protein